MSPKQKSSLVNICALIGAVVAVSGLMAPVARAVDNRFVKSEQYRIDSLNRFYEMQYIRLRLLKLDTMDAKLDTVLARMRRR